MISSKCFKFEKNQEFSPKIRNLLKLNLHSPVKENQNVSILFVERQSIQLSETGYNKTWTPFEEKTQMLKKSLRWCFQLRNKIQRFFSTCARFFEFLPLQHSYVVVKHVLKSAWVILRVVFEARLKQTLVLTKTSRKVSNSTCRKISLNFFPKLRSAILVAMGSLWGENRFSRFSRI